MCIRDRCVYRSNNPAYNTGILRMNLEDVYKRQSQKSAVLAFNTLKPGKKVWSGIGKFQALGNYVLMMFYTCLLYTSIQYMEIVK